MSDQISQIPSDEVRKDIEDTRQEIRTMQARLRLITMETEALTSGIMKREEFIVKLGRILRERGES